MPRRRANNVRATRCLTLPRRPAGGAVLTFHSAGLHLARRRGRRQLVGGRERRAAHPVSSQGRRQGAVAQAIDIVKAVDFAASHPRSRRRELRRRRRPPPRLSSLLSCRNSPPPQPRNRHALQLRLGRPLRRLLHAPVHRHRLLLGQYDDLRHVIFAPHRPEPHVRRHALGLHERRAAAGGVDVPGRSAPAAHRPAADGAPRLDARRRRLPLRLARDDARALPLVLRRALRAGHRPCVHVPDDGGGAVAAAPQGSRERRRRHGLRPRRLLLQLLHHRVVQPRSSARGRRRPRRRPLLQRTFGRAGPRPRLTAYDGRRLRRRPRPRLAPHPPAAADGAGTAPRRRRRAGDAGGGGAASTRPRRGPVEAAGGAARRRRQCRHLVLARRLAPAGGGDRRRRQHRRGADVPGGAVGARVVAALRLLLHGDGRRLRHLDVQDVRRAAGEYGPVPCHTSPRRTPHLTSHLTPHTSPHSPSYRRRGTPTSTSPSSAR